MSRDQQAWVQGLKIGHYTDSVGATGCTVALYPKGAVCAVDVRGSAPGTRETDALSSTSLVEAAHGVLLTGGSAFGLAAADGVMAYLAERGCGYPTQTCPVPIVPTAVIFDLAIGESSSRPGRDAGRSACENAREGGPAEGSVGAGTGATVAKRLGAGRMVKSGVGYAAERLSNGCILAALVVVNAVGDVFDYRTGELIAGPRGDQSGKDDSSNGGATFAADVSLSTNTTIGIVATDLPLLRWQAQKLAQCAQDGLALSVRPAHTMFDGDTFFALSTSPANGSVVSPGFLSELGWKATTLVCDAIERGVKLATGSHGVPAVSEIGSRE